MTILNAGRPEYYRHSGRFDTGRTPLALAGALAAAALLATMYAYVVLYLPIAGYITFLITGGFGLGAGAVMAHLLRWAKVRNTKLSFGLALAVGLFAVYWAWMVYLFALLQKESPNLPPLWFLGFLAIHPSLAWEIIQQINATGVWSLRGLQPSGIFLGLIWLVEAGGIAGIATWYPTKKLAEMPFCEACGEWGKTRPLASLAAGDPARLKTALEGKEFAALEQLGRSPVAARSWTQVTLQGCAACDTTQTLSVDWVLRTYNKEGKATDKCTPIVHQLRLSSDETIALAQAVARVMMPPQEPPVEPPPETPAEEKAQALAALEKLKEEPPGNQG